jgi:hypothetical protein
MGRDPPLDRELPRRWCFGLDSDGSRATFIIHSESFVISELSRGARRPERPSAAAGEPAPPQDPQQLASIQGRLLAQLQAGDPDAVATWELNNGAFRAAYPQQFRKINQAIRSYDFDAALAARPAAPAPFPISAAAPVAAP